MLMAEVGYCRAVGHQRRVLCDGRQLENLPADGLCLMPRISVRAGMRTPLEGTTSRVIASRLPLREWVPLIRPIENEEGSL